MENEGLGVFIATWAAVEVTRQRFMYCNRQTQGMGYMYGATILRRRFLKEALLSHFCLPGRGLGLFTSGVAPADGRKPSPLRAALDPDQSLSSSAARQCNAHRSRLPITTVESFP